MNGRKVTLTEVVRAQVALLFGRFRPAGGLSPEEQTAVRTERVEFTDRLVALVRAIDANEAAVVQEVRRITRDLYNAPDAKMPSVEGIAGRVKAAFQVRERPTCFGCDAMGGVYEHAGDTAILYPKRPGEVQWGRHGWLCLRHHTTLNWYLEREARRRNLPGVGGAPRIFDYPPPPTILPHGAPHASPPADDPLWTSWTDGPKMGPTARWAVEQVLKVEGWRVGETETPLLADVPAPARGASQPWDL